LLLFPILLSASSLDSAAWRDGILHEDFFVLLVLALTLLGLGAFYRRHLPEAKNSESRQLNAILLIAGSAYAYALLWLSLKAGLENNNTAVMLSLVIYTIIGLWFYFYGQMKAVRGLHLYGGALVGFVVVRLLLIDIWLMELAGRIATFFLIGALLAGTAFFGKKKT